MSKHDWHVFEGKPFSRPVIEEVVKGAWNPYLAIKDKFTCPQVAFTVAEVKSFIFFS